jgi:pyruvate/2-oxoglutarate dehydrogenase complex dihydrolipoamide acyltransferase (E2) component
VTLTTALALTLLVGLPLVLLAAGVLWQAYLLATRSTEAATDPTDAALRAMATASVDDLLLEIQRAIDELQGQVSSQRRTIESLLSAPAPLATAAATPAPTVAAAMPAAPALAPAAPAAAMSAPATADRVPTTLHMQLDQLLAEGLSDRAIARRLQVGLEEVRMARSLRGRP